MTIQISAYSNGDHIGIIWVPDGNKSISECRGFAVQKKVGNALNIIAIYQTYRWNAYETQHAQDPTVWHGPQDNDQWQGGHLTSANLAELQFWMCPG